MAAIPYKPQPGASMGGGSVHSASAIPGPMNAPPPSKPSNVLQLRGASHGLLRVVSNDELVASEKKTRDLSTMPEESITQLARYVRERFEKAVRHRRTVGIDDELIRDMRAYNGQYSPEKLQEIQRFGGSAVYSRMMAMKCRGATALMRDIYMNADRPWTLSPTSDPTIPDAIDLHVKMLIAAEVQKINARGQQVPQSTVKARLQQMYDAVKLSERRKAIVEAKHAQNKLDDMLEEGGFYPALSAFLSDLPVYKYAVIKGPITRRKVSIKWDRGGKIEQREEAKFFWERISPWDVWFSPGATSIDNTEVFERQRLSSLDLYNLKGLPGYIDAEIDAIISDYDAKGYKEWIQIFDWERANMEGRNNVLDDTYINAIEFHGTVLGKYLKEYNIPGATEDTKPYFVTCWAVANRIFKVMLNPSPRVRVPYYVTSFDKQPGSLYGNGIPAMANDITDVINATLRSLVNNLAIASGPQAAMDEEMISPSQDDKMYPWKVWKFIGDSSSNRKAIDFFQPNDNSQSLITVLDKFSTMLDDVSTIPRYLTGAGAGAGAGRTASGLSMLINNANKTLQNVADNIDNDVFQPMLQLLYDFVMLTDTTGMLRGDESILVEGVRLASKQEQDRTRQLEFLNIINNPNYQQLIGPGEVGRIIQKIADGLGMEIQISNPDDAPGATPPGLPRPPPPPPPPPPPVVKVNLNADLPPQDIQTVLNLPPLQGAPAAGGGPNPTGNNTPNPNPAQAAPGAGGVPGLQPGPSAS